MTTKTPRYELWTDDGFTMAYRTLADARRACDTRAARGEQAYVYERVGEDMEVVYDPCAE